MTKIRQLFDSTRSIDRRIEKVINYETTNEQLLKQEISEYVTTKSISEHFDRLLDLFDRGMGDGSREVGVWVSGFYGSGKSSFTKYLGFAFDPTKKLDDKPFSEWLGDRFDDQLLRTHLKAVAKRHPTAVIMLDLASEQLAGAQMHDIATVLFNKVVQWAGYSRDAKIADFELMLERDGRLDEFKERIKEIGNGREWATVKDQGLVANTWASRLAPEFYPEIWPDSASFKSIALDMRIKEDDRVHEMLALIRRRSGCENIIFIIDEVGQYIASRDELILKLQGFAEIVKNIGQGKVWILATAQQTLTEDDPRARFNSAKLFKLKDRFPVSVDIEATDIQEICYRRLLAKSDAGRKQLEALFDKHGQSLRHATSLQNTRFYKSDFDKTKFHELYPFLPQHFDILMALLGQLARSSGGIGLRSAIKIIQDVLVDASSLRTGAVLLADQPVGRIATANIFYDVLRKDIERGFRHIVQAVDKVAAGYGLDSTEHNVAKSIAVLQLLDDLPMTRENLAALMHPAVDATPMLDQVKDAVETLLKDPWVTINELDGNLCFMSEAVSDLDRKRKDITPSSSDLNRLVNNAIRNILTPLPQARLFNSHNVQSGISVMVNGMPRPLEGERNTIQTVIELADDANYKNLRDTRIGDSTQRQNSSCIYLLGHSSSTIEETATEIFRSDQIFKLNRNQSGEKELDDYLEGQRQRAENLQQDLEARIRQNLMAGTFIFQGRPKAVTEWHGSNLMQAANAQVQEAAQEVYHKYAEAPEQADGTLAERFLKTDRIDSITSKNDPLKLVKRDGGSPIDTSHRAIASIREYLEQHGTVDGRKLLDDFFAAPFGWSKDTTRYIVAAMLVAGEIKLRISGEDVTVRGDAAIDTLRNNNNFNKIGISLRTTKADPDAMLRAADRLLTLTGEQVMPLEEEISRIVTRFFPDYQRSYAPLATQLQNLGLPGVDRAQGIQDSLAEILKGDASDASGRLGGENCPLYEDLLWAREVSRAFENGIDGEIRTARKLLDEVQRLPKVGVLATLQEQTTETREEVANLLQRDNFHEHASDLRTGVNSLESAISKGCGDLQQECQEQFYRHRQDVVGMSEWSKLGADAQNDFANRMDTLQVQVQPGLDGIRELVNHRFTLDSTIQTIRQEIAKIANEVAESETETEEQEKETTATFSLKPVIRSMQDLDTLIAGLTALKTQLEQGGVVRIQFTQETYK
jgi:hypothetical protein